MNYKDEISKIQTQIEQKKLEKARLEERLKQISEEKEKLMIQMKELKIETVDELTTLITTLETELKDRVVSWQESLN